MTLPELYRAVRELIQNPTAHSAQLLCVEAQKIADMTSWAPGVIDPKGQAQAMSMELEQQLRKLYEQNRDQAIAELHDALCDVRAAIARHDDDLRPRRDDEDEDDMS